MARPKVNGRMLSTDALEGYCNEYGGLYVPPGVGGAYACLLPDGTLIVCGGGPPTYCVESHTLGEKGRLGLSDVQAENLTAQATDYEKFRIRAKADLDLAEADVEALVEDEEADLGAIEDALKKSEAARTAMRLGGIKALRATQAVLTPEQREEWRSWIEEMRLRHGEEGEPESVRERSERDGGSESAT
jgi:Heavy-metal resistance